MSKLQDIRNLVQEHAVSVSSSPGDWMDYMDTASRLYRYSFSDQLLIHAQRPDATACASLELWNEKMLRWVNRGARGIALFDETWQNTKLRYVFDISDTHMVAGGRSPYLWKMQEHQREEILTHLAEVYRESSTGETGQPDGEIAGEESSTGQGSRSDGMDGTHERTDGNSGREHLDGIGIQLVEDTREDGLSKAEEEIASALSLPEYPTANEQRRQIEERAAALYAGEILIPESVVDEILRTGGNRAGSQLRIIYNFMSEQTPEEYTEFVKREYRKGGKGFQIDGNEYSVWFDETGMQIAVGHTVTDQILDKAFLSWEDVSGRIHQLLDQGEYAPQSVLDAARNNAVKEHAQALAYMKGDMAEGVHLYGIIE